MKKTIKQNRRKTRIKAKIAAISARPRIVVFRSLKNIYAQIIDDTQGRTLVNASGKEVKEVEGLTGIVRAERVGEILAKKALKKKISQVVFDRRGYKYHGQVKALAMGARKAGLNF